MSSTNKRKSRRACVSCAKHSAAISMPHRAPGWGERHQRTTDGTLVEIKTGLNAVRGVREALLELAYGLQDQPSSTRGLLVLVEPRITSARLADEWELASKTFRPGVADHLGIVLMERNELQEFRGKLKPAILNRLRRMIDMEVGASRPNLPRIEYFPEILKILLHEWLQGRGPMTAERLTRFAGCTYPTVASALRRLAPLLVRHSDRRFELRQFSTQAWAGLIASGDRIRHTLRFADRSGAPRSPDLLIRRLARLRRTGVPRLDVTVHCPQHRLDTFFCRTGRSRLGPNTEP